MKKSQVLLSLLYFVLVLILLLHRFWQYEVFYYDHGYAESASWQVSQLENPQWDREGRSSVFIDHFYPSLVGIFAPFYWLSNSYLSPIVVLALLWGLSAFIAFEIGQSLKIKGLILYALVFAFLFYIGTQNAVIFFLKDITAATPFFLLMLLFLTKRSIKPYYLFLLVTLGFKETLSVTTFALGLATFLFFDKKWRPHAAATMFISLVWALLVSRLIIPFFVQQSGKMGGYAFAPDLSGPLLGYFTELFNNPVKRETITTSMISFGFLPLITPVGIIMALQDFGQRFVLLHRGNPFRWGLNLHYNINLAVVLFYSSCLAVSRLQKFKLYRRIMSLHALFIIGAIIYYHEIVYHGPFGLLINSEFYRITRKMDFMDDFVAKIPRQGKIMLPNNLAVRFTHEDLYLLSTLKYLKKVEPDVVALDFRPGQNTNNYWPATDISLKEMVDYLGNSPQYKPVYQEDYRVIYVKN